MSCRTNRKPTRAARRTKVERDRALAALEAMARQLDLFARILANVVSDIKGHRNEHSPFESYADPRAKIRGRKALIF